MSDSDSFTEVTEQGWMSRIGESIKGVLVGLLLFVAAFPLLWWNEGRAVSTAKRLEIGAKSVVSVSSKEVDKKNEGKLVHMSGNATTDETLTDPTFAVEAAAIRLERTVEMYQWVEKTKKKKKKKVGGKEETITTYSYVKEWKSSLVDSDNFKKRDKHHNPASMEYESDSWTANTVTVDAFTLSDPLKRQITKSEGVAFNDKMRNKLPKELKRRTKVDGERLYLGKTPGSPEIGDIRITFSKVPPADVSIVAQQAKATFTAFATDEGPLEPMLSMGNVTAEVMFQQAQEANVIMTWVLRLVFFFMMFAGLSMIFRPLTVVADVVPLFGDMLRMGFGLVAFAISLPLTLLTIAIAWLFYRPVLGIVLLVVAVAIGVGIKMLAAAKKKAAGAAAPASA